MILQEQVWKPWEMKETQFGPVELAVPTVRGVEAGLVHDPKARLLGRHAGSAGLFSTVKDLQIFLEHYLADDFARDLSQNFSPLDDKERSLAWNLEGDWLDLRAIQVPLSCGIVRIKKRSFFLSTVPMKRMRGLNGL